MNDGIGIRTDITFRGGVAEGASMLTALVAPAFGAVVKTVARRRGKNIGGIGLEKLEKSVIHKSMAIGFFASLPK
jgi:hypothetical protein